MAQNADVKQELVAIADELDRRGLKGMADEVTQILAAVVQEERIASLPDPEYLVQVADRLDQEGRYDEADRVTAYAQQVSMVRSAQVQDYQYRAQDYWNAVKNPALTGLKGGALAGGVGGTMVAPGVGTAVGAGLGGVLGGLGGAAVGGLNAARMGLQQGTANAIGLPDMTRAQQGMENAGQMQATLQRVQQLGAQISGIDAKINALRAKNPQDPQIQQLQQQKLQLMQQAQQARQQGGMNPNAPKAATQQEQAQYAKQYHLQMPGAQPGRPA